MGMKKYKMQQDVTGRSHFSWNEWGISAAKRQQNTLTITDNTMNEF